MPDDTTPVHLPTAEHVAREGRVTPDLVLALARDVRRAEGERDALMSSEQCAYEVCHKAEAYLTAIHDALWPDKPHGWAAGEATAAGGEILDGVAKVIAERDALRREVQRLRNCRCYEVPGPGDTTVLVRCDSCKALAAADAGAGRREG